MKQQETAQKPQKQLRQPGIERMMDPKPEVIGASYKGSNKLKGKIALITGGDSGIGRSVCVHYAREGADIAIVYLDEEQDAQDTFELVKSEGRNCLLIKGDVKQASFCKAAVKQTINEFGAINILVNNAGMHVPQKDLQDISDEQLEDTFSTNFLACFRFARAALNYMKEGDNIINTNSVTAYRSSPNLLDYSSTKGAITSFTSSLATNLAKKKIRVNAVAPGLVRTPLTVSTFDEAKIKSFGEEMAMQRAGQPSEIGPAYVFLASDDASFITGQVIHVNGGEIING